MKINLGGSDWTLKDFIGLDWVWRDSEKSDTPDVRFWRKATVPGTIYKDLLDNHEIADPYFERNSMLAEWVPARTWLYRKTFRAEESWKGKRIQLHFKGIDYEARIFLNGEEIGHHKGMYIPALLEISDQLRYGEENHLAVVIEPSPFEQPQVGRTEWVRTHKSRMTYWWDFCPRMIHIGIWDEVYLDITGPVRIEDVFVRPQLNDSFDHSADMALWYGRNLSNRVPASPTNRRRIRYSFR
jgi:beta-mannosidase